MRCRACGESAPTVFLDLGKQPLANRFLKPEQMSEPEPSFPLQVCRCATCGLVQLVDTVPKEAMFLDYAYATGASSPLVEHFRNLAAEILARWTSPPPGLVVDIGSNDGTLLRSFQAAGKRVLGIEPAVNIAAMARERGVDTWNAFFDESIAQRVRGEYGTAQVITATNVFAHVPDPHSFLRAADRLLAPEGVLVIEVPYLVDMLDRVEFDTIYHEHLSYFAVGPLVPLMRDCGFSMARVDRLAVHGGSLRLFLKKGKKEPSESVAALLRLEEERGLKDPRTYSTFAGRVEELRKRLLDLLRRFRKSGKRISAYGAPAKGNTLLNYCRIGPDLVEYATDTTPFKQGRYTPGTRIPIFPEEKFRQDPPDLSLMLAWNYADAILRKEQAFLRRGGKFILPIPEPRVIDRATPEGPR